MISFHAANRQYLQSRYLREATDDALQLRLDWIKNNLWSTDRYGQVTLPRSIPNHRKMIELYIHVLCEQLQRSKVVDLSINEAAIRREASAKYVGRGTVRPISFGLNCYAKFGEKEHMASALTGKLYIQPAAKYNDPSLNAAQIDDELRHFVVTPNKHLRISFSGLDELGNEVEVNPHLSELFHYMEVSNFYVWCCGLGFDARLFSDFDANAALVVKDRKKFESRFQHAMVKALPKAVSQHGQVQYFDPYNYRREGLVPGFSKSFKYLYQNEYRFIWQFSEKTELEPFSIDLGPLQDIAEVVELQ